MRAVLILVLFVAFVAALGAAYLANDYLARQRELASQGMEQLPTFTGQRVMVADSEIEAGTTVRSALIRWQPWPAEDILSGYKVIGSVEGETEAQIFSQRTRLERSVDGKVVRRLVAPGEPITDSMLFRREDAGFMAGALDPGKVALSVNVSAATSAAGFIMPGDRVNVMLTHNLQSSLPDDVIEAAGLQGIALRLVSETVVESVRVLAVDQTFNENDAEPEVARTVTLEVDPSQAEAITVADSMGDLTLVLRGLSDREKPVGLAALVGLTDRRDPAERPLVSDRQISPGIEQMIEIAQRNRAREEDIAELRRLLEAQQAAQARLEEQLARERSEAVGAQRRPWSVTVHRVLEDEIQERTVGSNTEDSAAPGAGAGGGPVGPIGALPGDDIPSDEILIQE
ncbi:Flp pilus assembly protein CpaB [Roseospira visakhapatnamensis]|uniref:Pilus assembly protein CpaB n=1 Tax=Roseospira visakhapatnamensis TaxID=390880 RepID=A0A7W6RFF5_9PROT|nr:Flp pilus assembly protein CpaB [Roseospira visakhapatnamensis]MBB4267565.1 pilus assembly protein CpaB [Roseospira visakhapatnamensis]